MISDLGFTHYTSDPHYGHRNIISFCNRPFVSVDEMQEEMVRRHNAVVGHDDHVLFVGDLFLPWIGFMLRLNGRKTLVAGNHDDRLTDSRLLREGFESVVRGSLYDELGGVKVTYNHFPPLRGEEGGFDTKYRDRRPDVRGVLIHGHTHQAEKITDYGTLHVGVDAWGYAPATADEVAALVKTVDDARRTP